MADRSPTTQKAEPPRIQCPKCRTLTATSHPSFPLCSNRSCGEYLTKCRYCTFYDPETVECTNRRVQQLFGDISGRLVIRDLDAYIDCPHHNSAIIFNPVVQAQKLLASVTRILVTVLLICGVAYGGILVNHKIQAKDATPGVFLATDSPGDVELNEEFSIRFTIRNLRNKDTGPLQLRLSERFFEWFELLEVYPMPRDMFIRGAGRYFLIDSVPGDAEMLVTMRFKPTQSGVYPFKVSIFSSEKAIYTDRKMWVEVL